jgi:hypothetical protein
MFVPSLNVLITGNLVNGKVAAPVKNVARWTALLDEVKKGRELGPVLTGRGDIGDTSLLAEMKAYLKAPAKFGEYKTLHLAQ